jgi:hypothetical protein
MLNTERSVCILYQQSQNIPNFVQKTSENMTDASVL